MKQILHLHIGQAGIQLGNAFWELYCLEHAVAADGTMATNAHSKGVGTFFEEVRAGKYITRAIDFDLDTESIDAVRAGKYRQIFHNQQLISAKQDAASNYARGYYSKGSKILDISTQAIRRVVERCEHLQGFFLYNSSGGGTGSGFGSLLIEKLSEKFEKKLTVGLCIFPSAKLSNSCTQPYNTALIASKLLSEEVMSIVLDNEAIYNICSRNLAIQAPCYTNINRVIAQACSSHTASMRYEGVLNADINQMYTNLVAYPRLNFIHSSYAPFVSNERAYLERSYVGQISRQVFQPANQMARCDPFHGKYMACTLAYRGDILSKDISPSIGSLKCKRTINFVDWAPTGFKVGINYEPMVVAGNELAKTYRSCSMLSNSTAMSAVFDRITYKFDTLYSKRAFVHWYRQEGLQESEFEAAREQLAALEADYLQAEEQVKQDQQQDEG